MGSVYSLGPFRLDTDSETLFRGSEPVGLGRRAVALLRVLVEQPGKPLSKNALIAAAWSGLIVEEANLTVQMTALRRALGEEPGGDRWIETLPRRGYRFVGPVTSHDSTPALRAEAARAPPLPEKPSIAVLPFQNMSGDAEQDYFADGMVEEIITALSRFRQLFVIARNSSFTYKGRTVDPKQVGHELGVRYVLTGSVRKAGERVRIIGQLIDAASATHLWADRIDGGLEDIFDLQDRVTASVVGAIAPTLEHAEIRRAQLKSTESLDAYEYYLRGMARFHQSTRASISDALHLFRQAIKLDPDYAAAFGMAAWCYVRRKGSRWAIDREQEISEATPLIRRALELGRDDAVALSAAGYALAYVVGDLEQGAAFLDQAVATNGNLAAALSLCGWPKLWLGDLDAANKLQARAMRLSPRDPQAFLMEAATSMAHFCAGRYNEASAWAIRAFGHQPNFIMSMAALAASDAQGGRINNARKTMMRMRELDSTLRVSSLKDWTPFRQSEYSARWAKSLQSAGLPY
jgi:TolB-like protein/Tfp pilus assembly protein PilF